eukprot:gene31762-38390_t
MNVEVDQEAVLHYHSQTKRFKDCLRSRQDVLLLQADKDGKLVNTPHPKSRLSPLMSAAVRGDHASVQFFLQEGADVETEIMKHGLLVRLAAERDYASLRSLLEMSYVTPSQMLQELKISSWITGPNTDSSCLSFLHWLFLLPGANLDRVINTHDPNLLHSAIELGAVEALALMLRYLDPNVKNERGYTPLMSACLSDNPAILPLFLQQERVNVNLTDTQGYTASMLCVEWNRPQQLKMLLGRRDHDLSHTNCYGETFTQLAQRMSKHFKVLHVVNECIGPLCLDGSRIG